MGDDLYVKVTHFPVPAGEPVEGESMWVRRISGTTTEGVGILTNNPVSCTTVCRGDFVEYGGGIWDGIHGEHPRHIRSFIKAKEEA